MSSFRYIVLLILLFPAGKALTQHQGKGVRAVLSGQEDEIQVNRDDFIYDMELLPGQEYTGYIYHWSDWGEAWGELYEDPEVGWLEISPSSFIAQGCEKPVPVGFTFRAPQQTGEYTTTVIDDEWNWPDNIITLIVTENPSYKMTDSVILAESPGSTYYRYHYHEYHGIDPSDSWYEKGYCGDDPYVFSPTRKIIHTVFPFRSNIAIEPSSFTLQLNEEAIITKTFQITENEVDSFYEMISTQWRSYPEYIKWKLVTADSYCLDWEQIPSLIEPSVQSGAEVFNDFIYLIGGQDPFTNKVLSRVEIFDGISWSVSAATMNSPRYDFAHAVLDNRLYVFGGRDETFSPTQSVEYYSGGSWHIHEDSMPAPLAGHSGIAYANNFYIFGGRGEDGYHPALWRFSTQNGWTVLVDSIPFSPMEGYQSIRIGRFMYVFGGYYSEDGGDTTFYSDVHLYDASTGNFSSTNPMNHTRAGFACGIINGILYVAGGVSDDPATGSSIEFYDPETGIWLSCNDEPDISIFPAAYTLKDNSLFLLGGAITYPNTTATYRTCYGSGFFTGEPQEPIEDPEPVLQAFPNPLRNEAVFIFDLPYDSKVTFQLFDTRGRLIQTFADEYLVADNYQFRINGRLFAEGLYFGRLQTEKHKIVKKIVKVKHY